MLQKPSVSKAHSFRNLINSNRGNSLPIQKTVHCGWLWKKGALNRTLANRRWFVIKGDQLYYFRDRGDSTPLGQISLAGNKIKRHPPVADTNGKFIFEIVAGEEREGRPVVDNLDTLLFATETPYEMEEWIKAINRVIYTPVGGGMFGRSIIETVKIDSRRGGGIVPIIVEQCVEYIRKHGLKEEGIFRVAGSQEDIEELKTAFNTGIMKHLDDGFKVTAVASVLKKYIGDLPDPVIPSENYDQFVFIGGVYKTEPEEAIKKFHEALREIPKEHFNLLKYLSRFLFELQQHEDATKMTISNLALIFGPNLLRPTGEEPGVLLQSLSDVNRTTMAIVLAQERLFPKTDDEKYYQPKDQKVEFHLGTLELDNDIKSRSLPSSPPISPQSNLRAEKRSLSESSLSDTILQNDNVYSGQDEVLELRKLLQLEREQHQEKVQELSEKLEREMKIREMIKLRLSEEHKARVQAEERLELYRLGIEDYCKKFGHANISIV